MYKTKNNGYAFTAAVITRVRTGEIVCAFGYVEQTVVGSDTVTCMDGTWTASGLDCQSTLSVCYRTVQTRTIPPQQPAASWPLAAFVLVSTMLSRWVADTSSSASSLSLFKCLSPISG